MFFYTQKVSECYGCGACKSACPTDAISVIEGKDTFLYPVIDPDKCINCKKCEKVCPNGRFPQRYPLYTEAAITSNTEDELKSSSGGAFKCIVKAYYNTIKQKKENFKLFICACEWQGHFQASHTLREYIDESSIDTYMKSKYVQSNTWGIYKDVKAKLQMHNVYVLFVGTPCQVAGLYGFLQKIYDNLLTIDLVCHGVPSQMTFNKYLNDIEEVEGCMVRIYEFRNKHILDNGTKYTRSSRIVFENGKEKKVTRFTDDYVNIFYTKPYHFRPSCYPCQFKCPKRVADITIGDAWKFNERYPELNPLKGISIITYNTKNALAIKYTIGIQMDIYKCDYEFMIDNNRPLRSPEVNKCSADTLDRFWKDIKSPDKSFAEAVTIYIDSFK